MLFRSLFVQQLLSDGAFMAHMILAGSLRQSLLPENEIARANGLFQAISGVGMMITTLAAGFIADAIPDAWGTRVAEAVFARRGWGAVTPMKLLAWIGDRAPGALSFQPALEEDGGLLGRITAERLSREAEDILRGRPDEIAAISAAGGSAGGAHPKALVVEHVDGTLSLSRIPVQAGDQASLLKLGLAGQPSVRVEHAYLEMARAAGIHVTP